MFNIDFGKDWGNAAELSFKNGHFILGAIQELNGMGEVVLDFGLAYFGAALLGTTETVITTGSLKVGLIDGTKQFRNNVKYLKNSFLNGFKNLFSAVSNEQKSLQSPQNAIPKPASTPVGRRGSPLKVSRGTNTPATINGRKYTGHALDQMQSRGFLPSVVEDTIETGERVEGNTEGTWVYITNQAKVIVNNKEDVVTVIPR